MQILPDIMKDIEKDLSQQITISLQYEELAKNLYPYIDKLYQQKNYIKNHTEQLKKTFTKEKKQ